LYISTDVRTMAEVWQGDIDLKKALTDETIKVHGNRKLIKAMSDWIGLCIYRDVRPVK